MILYILDNETRAKKLNKTVIIFLVLSIASIAVDNIYAVFGHGVRSSSMSLMFLYPLLGGTIVYSILRFITPEISLDRRYRLAYNLYNSGIATLTIGSFFKGILDIAGTASNYTNIFFIFGGAMSLVGIFILIFCAIKTKQL